MTAVMNDKVALQAFAERKKILEGLKFKVTIKTGFLDNENSFTHRIVEIGNREVEWGEWNKTSFITVHNLITDEEEVIKVVESYALGVYKTFHYKLVMGTEGEVKYVKL